MSDYLENLAIRTTGAGKDILVQPRLPSMYEALPPAADLAGQSSPSAKTEKEFQGAEPGTSATISVPPMRLPDLAGRAAGMSMPQDQPFPASAESDPQSVRSSRRQVVQEAGAKGPAAVQHPGGLPSETNVAAKNDKLQRDPILSPLDRVFPQESGPRPIDITDRHSPDRLAMSEADESDSEEMVESHLRDVSRSHQAKSREAGNQSRVKRDPGAPNAGPAFSDKARMRNLSSQGATVPPSGGRFEVGEVGQGEKERLPEPGTDFPFLSPRPSLRVQGPVPAFFPPAGRWQRNVDTAAARVTEREQPPVVRVSIGRVEVRAIMPAAPSEKAALPKPRMSLDEYLRQQNEAKR